MKGTVNELSNSSLHVAVIQMDVKIGDPSSNYQHIERLLDEAVDSSGIASFTKPDVIVLPEMWNTGYALTELADIADEQGVRTRGMLSAFAKHHQVNIVAGSVAVKQADGTFANRSFVFNRNGEVVHHYDKLHLFRLMDEEQFLQQGVHSGEFRMDDISFGIMICYDIRFPELARKLALGGAQILFVPAQWPNPRKNHWRTLLQARAIENQMYVVACNRVGVSGDTSFFGSSMVIDPWGEVLAEGGEQEQILRVAIDLELVADVRKRIPIFADRRPEFY